MLIDNPIVNSPFEEPALYRECLEGQLVRVENGCLFELLPAALH